MADQIQSLTSEAMSLLESGDKEGADAAFERRDEIARQEAGEAPAPQSVEVEQEAPPDLGFDGCVEHATEILNATSEGRALIASGVPVEQMVSEAREGVAHFAAAFGEDVKTALNTPAVSASGEA